MAPWPPWNKMKFNSFWSQHRQVERLCLQYSHWQPSFCIPHNHHYLLSVQRRRCSPSICDSVVVPPIGMRLAVPLECLFSHAGQWSVPGAAVLPHHMRMALLGCKLHGGCGSLWDCLSCTLPAVVHTPLHRALPHPSCAVVLACLRPDRLCCGPVPSTWYPPFQPSSSVLSSQVPVSPSALVPLHACAHACL